MSSWEVPPPLPQRPPRPDGQHQYHHRPGPQPYYHQPPIQLVDSDEKPPPLPSRPRPRSRVDLESISGSIRDSWRQLRTGLDYVDTSGGLKPPALPPRPVSASAVPDRQQRPISPSTFYSTTHSDTHIRTASSTSSRHGQGRPSFASEAGRRDDEVNRMLSELSVSPGHQTQPPDMHPPATTHQPGLHPPATAHHPGVHHSATAHQPDAYYLATAQSPDVHHSATAHQPGVQDTAAVRQADVYHNATAHQPGVQDTAAVRQADMHHNATPPRPTAVSDEVSPARSQQSVTTPPAKAPITAETACINIPLSAPATWYSHRDAPDIYICTRCYDGHLRDTQFRHEFNSTYLDDHQPRACRFSTPRIQKHLLATAAQTGSLGELIAHMKSRAVIPNCKGIGGASAAEGIKWFIAKDNAIPGMVICEACWEDFVVVSPFASRFQRPDYQQDEKVVWACDMAVPFIRKELDRRAEVSDWTGFAAEAGGRLSIPPCGKAERVPRRSRKWLCPKDMPAVVACPACFCDHVVGSGEEDRWREWEEVPGLEFADNFICALGQFTIGLAMSFAEDRNDYSLFWRALVKAAEGPECNPEGTKGATWYTLRDSDPRDFFVCGLCHAAIVEPMGMGGFFTAKPGVPPDAAPRCCLNPRFPRFMSYLQKLLDGYFAQSTAALSAFASDYASLPLCRRDTLLQDAAWYGWPECTICPECHHEFIRGTALADAMPYQGGRWETSTMCKMYSPRMRALYLEACRANPPDATEMLAYSEHRTGVYVRTVMVVKQILQQQRMAIYQQQRLNGQSLFYTSLGNTQANLLGSDGRTYGAAGVGYGFQNEFQLDGARYGKQAMEVGASVRSGSAAIQIEELERQWKMVE